MISAVVMASGFSRRMGKENKLLLDINGSKVVEYILRTLEQSDIDQIILVSNNSEIMDIGRQYSCRIQVNSHPEKGISASIKEGCKQCNMSDGIMLTQADQPLLTVKTINKLVDAFNLFPNNIIIPCYDNINASPVIFPNKYLKELSNLEGDRGGKVIINKNRDKVVYVAIKEKKESYDIDTIEDYNKIKKWIELS